MPRRCIAKLQWPIPLNRPSLLQAMSEALAVNEGSPAPKRRNVAADSIVYSNLDFDRPNPEGPVQMSPDATHTAPQLRIDPIGGLVTMPCAKGYCSAKASHGAEFGCWYFEVEVLRGAVRVGWGQTLAEVQAPVGYDEFGYGYSNRHAALFHCCRSVQTGEASKEACVIGCLIRLPQDIASVKLLTEEEKIHAIEAQFPPLHFNLNYRIKQDVLSQAQVSFYVDGVKVSKHFAPVYRAKYFPMVSLFKDAQARVTLGESGLRFSLPEGALPFDQCK